MRKPGYGLRQDSRGRWVATCSIEGKRHYRVIGGGSRRLAERLAAEWASDVRQIYERPSAGSVAALCDRWLASDPERRPSYQRSAAQVIGTHIRPALGPVAVERLTVADVDSMLAAMTARGLAPATVTQARAVLRSVLRLAEREDLVARNVARAAKPPKARQAPHRLPTARAVQDAISAAWALGPMPGILVELAALTGARRGELVAIRWADIDLGERLVTISGSLTALAGGEIERGPTKTRQTRQLGLPDQLTGRLRGERARQAALLGRPPTWLVWSDPAGRIPWRPDRLSKTWDRVRAVVPGLAGVRLHDLRHWVGSELIDAGESLVSAAAQLGHSSTAMLASRYGHPTADAVRRRAGLLAAKLSSETA